MNYQSIKLKSFSMLQEKRRKEIIEKNRKMRDVMISKRREKRLLCEDGTQFTQSFENTKDDNVEKQERRRTDAISDNIRRRQFSQTLCIPEWMTEIPNSMTQNWLVLPRPEGKRYILSSKRGKTILRGINGNTKQVKSNLPGSALNFRGNCVLDVIVNDSGIYVMDLIYFNNVDYGESEAESRLFMIISRISEEPFFVIFQGKQLSVKPVPYFECSIESLYMAYHWSQPTSESDHYKTNGILFIERYGPIEEGSTPLQLLWKDYLFQFFSKISNRTAEYFINTDANGVVTDQQEVTLLYKNGFLQSLEEIRVVETGILQDVIEESLIRCSINGVEKNDGDQWILCGVSLLGLASLSKTLPDTLSKIIFQHMARSSPLTIDCIIAAINKQAIES